MATSSAAGLLEVPDSRLHQQFRDDVLSGLSHERKAIPARWFYDHRGSELFEQITQLPEYYLTRAEIEILKVCCPEIAQEVGRDWTVVEFGAGSATKTPLLLDCIDACSYVPIDISGKFLRESCGNLAQRYPDLPVFAIEADFTRPVAIPGELLGHDRLGFFPGSTIGNMVPHAAVDLLRVMRRTLGERSMLLIGMDAIKDRDVLISAYDDAAGLTAEFNLNLVHRINRELDGTLPAGALRHKAVWNDAHARIEMHLEATRDIGFHVCGRYFTMLAGETVHTENSHKYEERSARMLLLAGGWEPVRLFRDDEQRFMVFLARAMDIGGMP